MRGIKIQHRDNGSEVKLGESNLSVDGFCSDSNTVFEFHGCYWHGHSCPMTAAASDKEDQARRRKETAEKDAYIRSLGYGLVVMQECEWQAAVREDKEKRRFLGVLGRAAYPQRGNEVSQDRWVERIKSGSFLDWYSETLLCQTVSKTSFQRCHQYLKTPSLEESS